MRKMTLKALSCLLVVIMAVSSLPIAVFADNDKKAEKNAVNAYLTVSEDGWFAYGNDDNSTCIARQPIEVEYFDLSEYGLSEFNRYTENENGEKVLDTTPTLFHLLIRATEKYYLGGEKLQIGTDAMSVSGTAGSLWMSEFWGNPGNIAYFIDHKFYKSSDGNSISADNVELKNGMEIDLAMFTDSNFYMDCNFAYFAASSYSDNSKTYYCSGKNIKQNFYIKQVSYTNEIYGNQIKADFAKNMQVMLLDSDFNPTDDFDLTDIASSGNFSKSFDAFGEYYIAAVDADMSDNKFFAPAIVKVSINQNLSSFSIKDSYDSVIKLSPEFDGEIYEYNIDIPETEKKITISAATNNNKAPASTIEVNSFKGTGTWNLNTADLNGKISIVITADTGEKTVYTVNVNTLSSLKKEISVNESDAVISLTDYNNARVFPDKDGKYSVIENKTYHYTISKKGFKTESGSFTGSDEPLNISLKLLETKKDYKELDSEWPSFRRNENNNGITDAKSPIDAESSALYWANKIGSGWGGNATSSPIIVEDSLVVYAGTRIVKVNKFTGEIQAEGTMTAASSFSIIPPTYSNGMIFVGLSNGTIQAFSAETLESLWIYHDSNKGQPNSSITVKNGYLYTGFWVSEDKYANFVCLDITDENPSKPDEEKSAVWTHLQKGGFYWAGAYANDDFVVVGTDDGEKSSDSQTSELLVINAKTGVLIDKISGLDGDIRSNVVYDNDTNRYYFTSKNGSFYSVAINKDGSISKINGENDIKQIKLSNSEGGTAQTTSTPVIYNKRAYIGVSGSSAFTQNSGHYIAVIDLESFKVAYTATTKGYVQSSGLLTTGYTDKEGYAYIYFIENYTPGNVRVIKDKPGVTSLIDGKDETYTLYGKETTFKNCAPILFSPSGAQSQYAICSVIADKDGTLYFKNDSAYLMAVGSDIVDIEVTCTPNKTVYLEGEKFDPAGMKVTAHLANGYSRDVTKLVEYSNESLTINDKEIALDYKYVMYGNRKDENGTFVDGVTINPKHAYVELNVITSYEKNAVKIAEEKINAIGEVTKKSYKNIISARAVYDVLNENLKPLVSNINILLNAEAIYKNKYDPDTCKHSFKLIDSVSPDCVKQGINVYKCDTCELTFHDKVSEIGHKTYVKGALKPNYFAKGYTGDTVCKLCGKVIKKGKSISVLQLKSPKITVVSGKAKITVKYKKVSGASGYQVRYKQSKGKWVTKTYKSSKAAKKVYSGLKKKKYNVQVRAMKKSGSKTVFSKWTKNKTIKVK